MQEFTPSDSGLEKSDIDNPRILAMLDQRQQQAEEETRLLRAQFEIVSFQTNENTDTQNPIQDARVGNF